MTDTEREQDLDSWVLSVPSHYQTPHSAYRAGHDAATARAQERIAELERELAGVTASRKLEIQGRQDAAYRRDTAEARVAELDEMCKEQAAMEIWLVLERQQALSRAEAAERDLEKYRRMYEQAESSNDQLTARVAELEDNLAEARESALRAKLSEMWRPDMLSREENDEIEALLNPTRQQRDDKPVEREREEE